MNAPENLAAWRKARRAELIARRLALSAIERERLHAAIAQHVDDLRPALRDLVVGFCWPYRGEPDFSRLMQSWVDEGIVAALSALADKRAPMQFRRWSKDVRMTQGAYAIPIPVGTEALVPDVILVPMVAHDDHAYRLGYGGGYFDRMMAGLVPAPLTVGISLEQSRLHTIYPQPHDVPMDCIVTEAGLHSAAATGVQRLAGAEAVEYLRSLAQSRLLPRVQAGIANVPRIELSSPVCYAAEFPGYFGETEEPPQKK